MTFPPFAVSKRVVPPVARRSVAAALVALAAVAAAQQKAEVTSTHAIARVRFAQPDETAEVVIYSEGLVETDASIVLGGRRFEGSRQQVLNATVRRRLRALVDRAAAESTAEATPGAPLVLRRGARDVAGAGGAACRELRALAEKLGGVPYATALAYRQAAEDAEHVSALKAAAVLYGKSVNVLGTFVAPDAEPNETAAEIAESERMMAEGAYRGAANLLRRLSDARLDLSREYFEHAAADPEVLFPAAAHVRPTPIVVEER